MLSTLVIIPILRMRKLRPWVTCPKDIYVQLESSREDLNQVACRFSATVRELSSPLHHRGRGSHGFVKQGKHGTFRICKAYLLWGFQFPQ